MFNNESDERTKTFEQHFLASALIAVSACTLPFFLPGTLPILIAIIATLAFAINAQPLPKILELGPESSSSKNIKRAVRAVSCLLLVACIFSVATNFSQISAFFSNPALFNPSIPEIIALALIGVLSIAIVIDKVFPQKKTGNFVPFFYTATVSYKLSINNQLKTNLKDKGESYFIKNGEGPGTTFLFGVPRTLAYIPIQIKEGLDNILYKKSSDNLGFEPRPKNSTINLLLKIIIIPIKMLLFPFLITLSLPTVIASANNLRKDTKEANLQKEINEIIRPYKKKQKQDKRFRSRYNQINSPPKLDTVTENQTNKYSAPNNLGSSNDTSDSSASSDSGSSNTSNSGPSNDTSYSSASSDSGSSNDTRNSGSSNDTSYSSAPSDSGSSNDTSYSSAPRNSGSSNDTNNSGSSNDTSDSGSSNNTRNSGSSNDTSEYSASDLHSKRGRCSSRQNSGNSTSRRNTI